MASASAVSTKAAINSVLFSKIFSRFKSRSASANIASRQTAIKMFIYSPNRQKSGCPIIATAEKFKFHKIFLDIAIYIMIK